MAEAFAKRFGEAMAQMKLGHGLDEGVQVGPLIDGPTRAKVTALVEEALDRGAQVRRPKGLVDPDHDSQPARGRPPLTLDHRAAWMSSPPTCPAPRIRGG